MRPASASSPSQADGGVCGVATQAATSNFATSDVAEVPTTTTLTATSTGPRALRLVAKVAGSPTPTGTVEFIDETTAASLGTASLIGGTATLNLSGLAPGTYPVSAAYTPTADSAFVASEGSATAVVTTSSSLKESFPSSVKGKKSAKGVVTVSLAGTSAKATGKVVIKKGSKTIATATLTNGQASFRIKASKLGKGKSTLIASWAGNALSAGSTKSFSITVKK